jgi:hypothetical protein
MQPAPGYQRAVSAPKPVPDASALATTLDELRSVEKRVAMVREQLSAVLNRAGVDGSYTESPAAPLAQVGLIPEINGVMRGVESLLNDVEALSARLPAIA